MACKNTWKNAVLLEKKRKENCDIFPPPLGVPLCALKCCFCTCKMTPMRSRLAKRCFCNKRKIEKEFEKKKWHVKIHGKMPFY